MSKTKGTDVISLRAILAKRGPEDQKAFLSSLGERLATIYQGITANSWTEIADQMAIYQAAAKVLFPGDPNGLQSLGKAMAALSYSGIYRIFLRIPTIEFIFKRAARIWNTYFEKGDAKIETVSAKCVDLVVANFPELPKPMRELANGHYLVLLQATGAKQIRIQMLDQDPNAWRWRVSWE